MRILSDHSAIAMLLDELLQAGYLVCQPTPTVVAPGRWRVAETASSQGYVHRNGNRYWGVDVSGMIPVYQEIYRRIFAERLVIWGLAEEEEAGILYVEGLILVWGPDEVMRAKQPAAVAHRHIEEADEAWLEGLQGWWQQAAIDMEDQVDHFWTELCVGHPTTQTFQYLVECKVTLNAIGVDALMPPVKLVKEWLALHIPACLLAEVVEGCYLPASGYLAYDVLEMECWRLADSVQRLGHIVDQARTRFVQQGLFFLYNALNTDQKEYLLHQYPIEIATKYGQAAPEPDEAAARMEEVRQRHWRRRYHHQWARQQLEASVADSAVRQRLFVLHRLLGTARDFDEEKRRLNMKLWRSLFALADGLGISLTQPQVVPEYLCDAIHLCGGHVVIDPVFTSH